MSEELKKEFTGGGEKSAVKSAVTSEESLIRGILAQNGVNFDNLRKVLRTLNDGDLSCLQGYLTILQNCIEKEVTEKTAISF